MEWRRPCWGWRWVAVLCAGLLLPCPFTAAASPRTRRALQTGVEIPPDEIDLGRYASQFAREAYRENSCWSAHDGECDESHFCTAGTDTADCSGLACIVVEQIPAGCACPSSWQCRWRNGAPASYCYAPLLQLQGCPDTIPSDIKEDYGWSYVACGNRCSHGEQAALLATAPPVLTITLDWSMQAYGGT